MFLSFKMTLTTTASKTSELVDLTYQEPIWRCPEWPATCWCWNPRSVCPGSTADPLAHWQTQDKHRNTPPGVCQKTQYAEGREKSTGPQHWSTRGQLCQRVQWEGWGGGLFFYFQVSIPTFQPSRPGLSCWQFLKAGCSPGLPEE